jgi:hypothetical protein
MRARGFFTFVLLNVLITAGIAYLVVSTLGPTPGPSEQPERFATVLLIVTATPDPNVTAAVRIITATPEPGTISTIPTGVLDPVPTTVADNATVETGDNIVPAASTPVPPTLDPETAANAEVQATANALPAGCILHVLQEGEFISLLAETYEADMFEILEVNGLTEEDATFLQIGEVLIVPLEGCSLTGPLPTAESGSSDGTLAADVTLAPTLTPTVTLAPTAVNAQVEISEVIGDGDITSERVLIINRGATVTITGWTLSA